MVPKATPRQALGLPDLVTAAGWLQRYYGASGNTAHEAIHSCPAYANFRWATATAIHYGHEDVPYAFVPFVAIALQLGIPTPVPRGLVDLCGGRSTPTFGWRVRTWPSSGWRSWMATAFADWFKDSPPNHRENDLLQSCASH